MCETPSQFSAASNPLQKDYSPLLAQIDITSNFLQGISTLGKFVSLLDKVGPIIGVFGDVMGLLTGMFSPSFDEILFDYLKQEFDLINQKLDRIYNQTVIPLCFFVENLTRSQKIGNLHRRCC